MNSRVLIFSIQNIIYLFCFSVEYHTNYFTLENIHNTASTYHVYVVILKY